MSAAPRPISLGLESYLDRQKREEAAYPIPTVVPRIKVSVPDPVDLWIRGGGSGGSATGTVPNTPPKSTDTKYRGIKIPTVAGSEGGFWGLTFGLAAFVFVCAIVLWWFLRRRKARRTNPSASNTSTTTHNSFTSLASLFRRPFSRRSNNAPPLDSTTASKRGWLHGSARDWNEIEEDESDLVGGRGRPGESMELYNQISKNNPDPVGTMERRGSKSPLPGESPLFPPSGGSHPYGQGGGATSSNSLGNFASTSTIRLASPAADGGTPQEYRDHSPFEEGGSESGYFTPSEETRAEERPRVLQGERPLSGKFREDDNHSVDSRSRR
ncbi:hypothetical protein BDY24DRAFT_403420 [Mrakia frigida]|uniref:uncharacterized protein n=1 Tax=Mrakia frigida TaxID=29902 RepID=UPI003FCC1AA5